MGGVKRLVAVPDAELRDGVYVRVSAVMGRSDERFLSPDLQREAIDRTRGRGPASRVVGEWRDIDVSTARVALDKRAGLQEALAAARAGKIDRLWFLVLDRFDRDTAALKVFDEIAALGVELWTEAGRIDVETPEGYLSVTMQLAIARYHRDRIGKNWRATHLHRIEQGLTHSGKARFGYIYDKALRLHVPDPKTGPVLADLYSRYVAGESVYTMVRWLNERGHRTSAGALWTDGTLRRLMDSGFAAGILIFRDDTYPGAHEPLISPETWEAYLAARSGRRVKVNTERSQYLLSGMVRCSCGSPMTAGQFGARHEPKYRCRAARESGIHSGGYVMASFVEGAVVAWLEEVAGDVEAAVDLALAAERKHAGFELDVDRLSGRVAEVQAKITTLTLQLASGLIRQQAYESATAALYAEQELLEGQIAELGLRAGAARAERPQAAAAALLRDWELLGVAQRREALSRLISRVIVTPGRPRGIIEIVPAWS